MVNYPKESTIVGSDADTLVDLLGRLSDAVRRDEGLLPGDFANELRGRFNCDNTVLIASGTYAEAGMAVRMHIDAFQALARAFFDRESSTVGDPA